MSSLIEQAALRLEQLRQAGIEIPEIDAPVAAPAAPAARVAFAPSAADRMDLPAPPSVGAVDRSGGDVFAKSRHVELDLAKIASAGIVTPNAPRSQIGRAHV